MNTEMHRTNKGSADRHDRNNIVCPRPKDKTNIMLCKLRTQEENAHSIIGVPKNSDNYVKKYEDLNMCKILHILQHV